jgi:hypothetical protein
MMGFRRRLFAASLVSALAGCAQPAPPGATSQPGVTPHEEESPRFIGVIGSKTQHQPPFLGVPETNYYRLRSFVDRQTAETLHQLYVSDSYSGAERHWSAARDGAGRSLRFFKIDEHEIACSGGCAYLEEFAVTIPEAELRASPHGLTVVFGSSSGAEKRIIVTGAQIAAQLAAVEARRSPVQPASATQSPPSHQ